MGRHATQPDSEHMQGMGAIVCPLVEYDLDQTATQQHTGSHEDAQVIDLSYIHVEKAANTLDPAEQREKAKRVAESVPPQVHAADLSDNGVYVVDKGAGHNDPGSGSAVSTNRDLAVVLRKIRPSPR